MAAIYFSTFHRVYTRLFICVSAFIALRFIAIFHRLPVPAKISDLPDRQKRASLVQTDTNRDCKCNRWRTAAVAKWLLFPTPRIHSDQAVYGQPVMAISSAINFTILLTRTRANATRNKTHIQVHNQLQRRMLVRHLMPPHQVRKGCFDQNGENERERERGLKP